MLDKIMRSIGNEVLDEVGDEITDFFFGKFKEAAFAAGIAIMMLIIYFIFVGMKHSLS